MDEPVPAACRGCGTNLNDPPSGSFGGFQHEANCLALKLGEASKRIDALEIRLELKVKVLENGDFIDKGDYLLAIGDCDGIGCRDETIKILDEQRKRLTEQRDSALLRLDTERRELDVADEKNLRLQGELKAANDAWHEQEDELRALRAGYAELLAINVQQGDQLHAMESRLGSVQNALRRLLGALPAEWRTPVGHDADCRCVQHEAFAAVDNRWGIDSQYPSAVEIPVRKSE
jgi:hypothetical protein